MWYRSHFPVASLTSSLTLKNDDKQQRNSLFPLKLKFGSNYLLMSRSSIKVRIEVFMHEDVDVLVRWFD